MITSIFGKTKPVNFIFSLLFVLVFFLIAHLSQCPEGLSVANIFKLIGRLFLLVFSVFLVDFISKKNSLSRNNHFIILIYVTILCLFPQIFISSNVMIANVMILLAIRRLMSLRSNQNIKLKLFDSTLFIVLGVIYYDWTVFYFVLIYVAIILFDARDFRNWLVPVIGVFTVMMLAYTWFLYQDEVDRLINMLRFKVELNTGKYYLPAYLLPVIFLTTLGSVSFISFMINIKKRLAASPAMAMMIVAMLICGIFISLVSDDENVSQFIFTAFPLGVIITNYLERIERGWVKDTLLWAFVLLPFLVLML